MTSAPDRNARAEPHGRRHAARDALSLVSARRREWSPPARPGPVTLEEPLFPGGDSNQSFLVHNGCARLVLRLDGIDPARNLIDRAAEFHLQAAAAGAGLAPRPRFCDADAGVFLVDYLPPDASPGAASAADLAGLLRAIHQLDADAPRLCLGTRVAHYAALTRSFSDSAVCRVLAHLSAPLARACHALDADTGATVICHNDLTPANRLYHNGRLYALDWEYAASGSRWFDIAVAAGGPAPSPRLLENYLQRAASAEERAQMARAGLVARYLELLWLACNTAIAPWDLLSGLDDLAARSDPVATAGHAS